MISVTWGNRLERLADAMFDAHARDPLDPFQPECVVVNSPTIESWLKHHFLYERRGSGGQRVLANWDVQLLYPFVNNWLFRMSHGGDEARVAKYHPYARACLQWQVYDLLGSDLIDQAPFSALREYLSRDAQVSCKRRFELAGMLANLFDNYQVYRPDMLRDWQKGRATGATEQPWQPELWRALVARSPDSYLSQFYAIEKHLAPAIRATGLTRVTVFGVSAMPPVYLHFFQCFPESVAVRIYVFNPCAELWDQDLAPRELESRAARLALQGMDDARAYLDSGNPLLSSLGKGCQSYLAEMLDRTGGDITDAFDMREDDSVLHVIQNDISQRRWIEAAGESSVQTRPRTLLSPRRIASDRSLQLHICHSPMREVEVLRDHLLRWFSENADLEPRHIQVLVSDMDAYAPYIQSVFAPSAPAAADAIPYALSDLHTSATSLAQSAFMTLLDLPGGRFKASELIALLEADAVREAFHFDADAFDSVRRWVQQSGIRWGRDRAHRSQILDADAEDVTTWQHGIDRMLYGYAMGRGETPAAGALLPYDAIEGGDAEILGRLVRFFSELKTTADTFGKPCDRATWEIRLVNLIDAFFANTNDTYRDITSLRVAVSDFARTAEAAGIEGPLPLDVVVSFLKTSLAAATTGRGLHRNAVLFSPLRAMRSTPRRIVCLLGLHDGAFPRVDRHSSFDLMAAARRRGDRSNRLDDRQAFLEAIMNAGERLYISYVGRTDKTNESVPPSTVVCELREVLESGFALPPSHKTEDGEDLLSCETLHHLQAFHVDYFRDDSRLFSYSEADRAAAGALHARRVAPDEDGIQPDPTIRATTADEPLRVTLEELTRCMHNPARHYYHNALQVRFDDLSDTILSDSELFSPQGLDAYEINDAVLRAQLAGQDPTPLHGQLVQQGLAPLGAPGRADMRDRWEKIASFLQSPITVDGEEKLLGATLAPGSPDAPVPLAVTLALGPHQVAGTAQVSGRDSDAPFLVFCRYSHIKARYRLQCWLSHLLLCARLPGLETHVLTRGSGSSAQHSIFQPVPAADCLERLTACVGLFMRASESLLPFAPETSFAWHSAIAGGKPPEDARRLAANAWQGNAFVRGECSDPYLARAFDAAGPASLPGFAELAAQVFDPMIHSLARRTKT